ncbi:MAG: hypothetical protein ABJB66_18155 [Gemmatimonadaceae bacterium]
MTDRNWEQELAKIDKQLASVSDEQLLAQNAAPSAPQRGPVAAPNAKAAPVATKAAASVAPSKTVGSWIAWVQLVVASGAASGLWFWPWGTRCGLNAIGFTTAAGAVTLLGLWSAVGSWKHRQSYAHVLSFGVMIWGLVLGAREVLPRVGYAIPSDARPAGWTCDAPITAPNATPPASPATTPAVNPLTNPSTIPSPIPPAPSRP